LKIYPVGAELFHADRQTDGGRTNMTKLIVAFRHFAKAHASIVCTCGHACATHFRLWKVCSRV